MTKTASQVGGNPLPNAKLSETHVSTFGVFTFSIFQGWGEIFFNSLEAAYLQNLKGMPKEGPEINHVSLIMN